MPLDPGSLEKHPDKSKINKVDPEQAGYRNQSKFEDRYCGNCPWFQEDKNFEDMSDVSGDEHPAADGKGTIHRCGIVGGGIARGGYCSLWGTSKFCKTLESPAAEAFEDKVTGILSEIKKKLKKYY